MWNGDSDRRLFGVDYTDDVALLSKDLSDL